jgi:hypothetical protein
MELMVLVAYTVGPQPYNLCLFQLMFINFIKTEILILLDFIKLSRYIFIFHLKNPAAVPDKYWARLLALWTFGFSVIFNYVIYILPGKCMYVLRYAYIEKAV